MGINNNLYGFGHTVKIVEQNYYETIKYIGLQLNKKKNITV